MKLSDFFKRNKMFVVCLAIVVTFFGFLMVRHSMQLDQLEKQYKQEIEDLRSLVKVTNIGMTPELKYDIYGSAENFMDLFYGISKKVSEEYRNEKLAELMTEDAFRKYVKNEPYDNSLDYEVSISNLKIYVDYKNSSEDAVYVCMFFDENTDWPNVGIIKLDKYFSGVFRFDEEGDKWCLDEILTCQELLTREEFEAYMTDTDISTME